MCGTVAHRVREVPTYVSNVRRTHERTNEATARRVLRALALAYKAAGGAAHSIERPGSTHVVRCCSRSPCSSTQKSAFLLEKWEPAPSAREQERERGGEVSNRVCGDVATAAAAAAYRTTGPAHATQVPARPTRGAGAWREAGGQAGSGRERSEAKASERRQRTNDEQQRRGEERAK